MRITENGEFLLPTQMFIGSILYISGTLGGGTATVKSGAIELVEGGVIVGERYTIDHGQGTGVTITVTGGTDVDCVIRVANAGDASLIDMQEQLDALARAQFPKLRADYTVTTPITLEPTLQLVTGWSAGYGALGFTENNGLFTVGAGLDCLFSQTLERIYINTDQTLTGALTVYIEIQINGEVVFAKNAPLNAATSPSEPATLPFTTPGLLPLKGGDVIGIYVGADDDGSTPQDTKLTRIKMVGHSIDNIPS